MIALIKKEKTLFMTMIVILIFQIIDTISTVWSIKNHYTYEMNPMAKGLVGSYNLIIVKVFPMLIACFLAMFVVRKYPNTRKAITIGLICITIIMGLVCIWGFRSDVIGIHSNY